MVSKGARCCKIQEKRGQASNWYKWSLDQGLGEDNGKCDWSDTWGCLEKHKELKVFSKWDMCTLRAEEFSWEYKNYRYTWFFFLE